MSQDHSSKVPLYLSAAEILFLQRVLRESLIDDDSHRDPTVKSLENSFQSALDLIQSKDMVGSESEVADTNESTYDSDVSMHKSVSENDQDSDDDSEQNSKFPGPSVHAALNRQSNRKSRAFNPTASTSSKKRSKRIANKFTGSQVTQGQPVDPPGYVGVPCAKRGGVSMQSTSRWTTQENLDSNMPGLSDKASMVLNAVLSPTTRSTLLDEEFLRALDDHLSSCVLQVGSLAGDTTLRATAEALDRIEVASSFLSFQHMLYVLHFGADLQYLRLQQGGLTDAHIYRTHLPDKLHKKAKAWAGQAAILALIAGGGTIYFLLLIAIASKRWDVCKLKHIDAARIGEILSRPSKTNAVGRLIIAEIIPALATVAQHFKWRLSSFISVKIVKAFGLEPETSFANLPISDQFFIFYHKIGFRIRRDDAAWTPFDRITDAPLQTDIRAASLSPIPEPEKSDVVDSDTDDGEKIPLIVSSGEWDTLNHSPHDMANVITIKTKFDPLKEANSQFPGPTGDRETIFRFTEIQRSKSTKAIRATDLKDLESKIQKQLATGVRDPSSFISFNPDILNGKILMIYDIWDKLMFMIDPSMPDPMRSGLVDKVGLIWPSNFSRCNTERMGFSHLYQCSHFHSWNRYSMDGTKAPKDARITDLVKIGATALPTPVISSLLVPHASRELLKHADTFELLSDYFDDVFRWQEKQLQSTMPRKAAMLQSYVDNLPGRDPSPVQPFAGIVTNLNVATTFHRDVMDWDICGILVISKCTGGALVLHEPGLVVEARNGDFMLFPSKTISHYNQHFDGLRASFVYHTDKDAIRWLDGKFNGWKDHVDFIVN